MEDAKKPKSFEYLFKIKGNSATVNKTLLYCGVQCNVIVEIKEFHVAQDGSKGIWLLTKCRETYDYESIKATFGPNIQEEIDKGAFDAFKDFMKLIV